MALDQVLIMANQVESARIGHQAISLTEFASNLECEIAAGSVVEVGGALYEAAANEPITGWAGIAADNDVWIKLTVAGASVTASFTTTAPTWSTSAQGWYDGAARYIGGLYKDAGGNYTLKYLYEGQSLVHSPSIYVQRGILVPTAGIDAGGVALLRKIIDIGDWDMDADASVDVAHGLAISSIRTILVMVQRSGFNLRYPIPHFDGGAIEAWIVQINATDVTLQRRAGGFFDSAGWSTVPYNRGWITIDYEA